MYRAFLVLTIAAGAAVVGLACTTETSVLPADQAVPNVSVGGSGSVFGEPDVAVLSLGVESEADTVEAARESAAEAMDAMLAALKDGGVEDEDIQTARFSVQPRFNFQNGRQELLGFVVNNLVTVTIREIDSTGELIDAAIAAGGDLARVENLSFTIDDPAALEAEARTQAVEDARGKAETLAAAAGVELGEALSISESGPSGIPSINFSRMEAADEAETPIEPGELEVAVNVQIVYELR